MMNYELKKEIICVGSVNMDLVMNVLEFPQPGETVLAKSFDTFPGGKGGNQAVAVSRLGGDVRMLTRLGDDNFSHQLNRALSDSGVNVENVIREENSISGIAMINVDTKGQNSISIFPGCNSNFSPEDIKNNENLFSHGKILLINMEIPVETVYEAIRTARKNGMFVILDPAPAPAGGIPQEIAKCVDIVKPNETEAAVITGIEITGRDKAIEALKKMKSMGFAVPMITMGKKGAIALESDTLVETNSFIVNAIDTTAAGDVFSGALTAKIAEGEKLHAAMKFAAAAAAISTTRKGAQNSVPAVREVEEFLNKNS